MEAQPAQVRMTFSGMNLLVVKPTTPDSKGEARVAALKSHHEHYPLLIVDEKQLRSEPKLKRANLDVYTKKSWLPQGRSWIGFEVGDHNLAYEGADLYADLQVARPSIVSGCPHGNADDLGWLVPFWSAHYGVKLADDWHARNADVACYSELRAGVVICVPPVDLPDDGKVKRYRYGTHEQAFTDSFTWKTGTKLGTFAIHATSRVTPHVGDVVALEPEAAEAIDCYLFNHPKDLKASRRGYHLAVVYKLFKNAPRLLMPLGTGACRIGFDAFAMSETPSAVAVHAELQLDRGATGTISVRNATAAAPSRPADGHGNHAHDDDGSGPRGEEYCAGGCIVQ